MFALEAPLSWLRLDTSNATTGWHDILTDSDFSVEVFLNWQAHVADCWDPQ